MFKNNRFRVMGQVCRTCIYRADSPLSLEKLENDVRDEHIGFKGWRICHHSHSDRACCRGFWNAHSWKFPAGQIAQRLGLVEFVDPPSVE